MPQRMEPGMKRVHRGGATCHDSMPFRRVTDDVQPIWQGPERRTITLFEGATAREMFVLKSSASKAACVNVIGSIVHLADIFASTRA